MEKQIYYNFLYDYYKELLTEKEKKYFIDYYFKDYSLKEIAENYNVSRNAVYNILKIVIKKLDNYESKLKLYSKGNKIKKIISNLDNEIKNKIDELI